MHLFDAAINLVPYGLLCSLGNLGSSFITDGTQIFQTADETISEFVADLRRLSIKCEFKEFLDQALRDRFVCGVRSEAIQKRLITEADLTIKRAQEIAQGMEADARDLQGATNTQARVSDVVHSVTPEGSPSGTSSGRPPRCRRCGRRMRKVRASWRMPSATSVGRKAISHPFADPPSGHFPRQSGARSYRGRGGGATQWVDTDCDDTALPLFVRDIPQPPIVVTMKLSGTPVDFELDTGAAVTVMGEATFNRIYSQTNNSRGHPFDCEPTLGSSCGPWVPLKWR